MLIQETIEQFEERHKGHAIERLTPDPPYSDYTLECYDCKEFAEWKKNKKIRDDRD